MGFFSSFHNGNLNKLADQQQSLRRDHICSKTPFKAVVDQVSTSDPKPDTSHQSDLQIHPSSRPSDKPVNRVCWSSLPPQFVQRFESEIPFRGKLETIRGVSNYKTEETLGQDKNMSWTKYVTFSSSSEESEVSVEVKKSSKSKGDSSEQNKPKP